MTHPLEKIFWSAFTAWHGRAEANLPYYPVEKLQRIQDRRVRAMVRFAYETVPFYREFMKGNNLKPTDFRTAADLEKLPVVDSKELSETPGRFMSSALEDTRTLSMLTSGSSGLIKEIRHDIKALFRARAGGHRSRIVLSHFTGRTLGYREVRATRRGGTGPEIVRFYEENSWVPRRVGLERADTSPEDSFEENIRVINEHKPDVIGGFGSYIGAIYRWAWLRGKKIHMPKVVTYGGDSLLQHDRRIIENEFGIPVLSRYQACEALNIAFQCERRSGFHVCTDQVVLRIVDEKGNTLPAGQSGEIVISNLINRGTVLFNYRMGDLATLSPELCDCGRTLPVLSDLHGRLNDLIILADGEVRHESVVMSRLYAVPGVMQLQITQRGLSSFLIKVVLAGSDAMAVERDIRDNFLGIIGQAAGITLDIETVDAIPREKSGKFRSMISLCPK